MTTIRITPSLLNQVAEQHDSVADEIAVARSAGSEILSAVATHGPIMHQFKAAATRWFGAGTRPSPNTRRHTAPRPTTCVPARRRFSDQEEVNASELRLD